MKPESQDDIAPAIIVILTALFIAAILIIVAAIESMYP